MRLFPPSWPGIARMSVARSSQVAGGAGSTRVQSVAPLMRFPVAAHTQIADALSEYDNVFTTNYDLTVYWSYIQELGQVHIADFVWNTNHTFDPASTSVWDGWTALHYLHGAIHLWQAADDNNGKWTNADNGNLLRVASNYAPGSSRRPLFVSEGTSTAKMRAIRRSPYLTHCYDALTDNEDNTVIVGHSLSDWDDHIIEALRRGRPRDIAVAIYPHQPDDSIVEAKARITRPFPRHTVHFFDSETHPLGDPGLTIA